MLGDPVSQHGQHPHGGRRARDGHLPLGRLTEGVTGGFLKHGTRILVSIFLRLSLLFSSPYWEDPEGCWSRQLLLQKPQQPEQSLTFNV